MHNATSAAPPLPGAGERVAATAERAPPLPGVETVQVRRLKGGARLLCYFVALFCVKTHIPFPLLPPPAADGCRPRGPRRRPGHRPHWSVLLHRRRPRRGAGRHCPLRAGRGGRRRPAGRGRGGGRRAGPGPRRRGRRPCGSGHGCGPGGQGRDHGSGGVCARLAEPPCTLRSLRARAPGVPTTTASSHPSRLTSLELLPPLPPLLPPRRPSSASRRRRAPRWR